jgi:hypothetical protein
VPAAFTDQVRDNWPVRRDLATAPIAAAGLIIGYGVAVASGSRPLGGAVMGCLGLVCISIWLQRDGRRTAALLTAVGLVAFALSHVVAEVVGAWPAVLLAAAATAWACWRYSDARLRVGLR